MHWTHEPLVIAYAFFFGAAWGSFLNVLIYRLPREISVLRKPPSSCPGCSTPIRWYDNLPIVSWLALRGRCRQCKAPISIRYPLVEAAAGFLCVGALLRWGVSVTGVEVLVFSWVSLALGLIDFDFQDPAEHTDLSLHRVRADLFVPGQFDVVARFGRARRRSRLYLVARLAVGATVGALLPILVIVIYRLWRGVEGMGWGDVKYLAAIGAVVGLRGVVGVLVIGATLGAMVGVGLIFSGKGSGKTELPFGTFLALAAILWLYSPPSWLAMLPW